MLNYSEISLNCLVKPLNISSPAKEQMEKEIHVGNQLTQVYLENGH